MKPLILPAGTEALQTHSPGWRFRPGLWVDSLFTKAACRHPPLPSKSSAAAAGAGLHAARHFALTFHFFAAIIQIACSHSIPQSVS